MRTGPPARHSTRSRFSVSALGPRINAVPTTKRTLFARRVGPCSKRSFADQLISNSDHSPSSDWWVALGFRGDGTSRSPLRWSVTRMLLPPGIQGLCNFVRSLRLPSGGARCGDRAAWCSRAGAVAPASGSIHLSLRHSPCTGSASEDWNKVRQAGIQPLRPKTWARGRDRRGLPRDGKPPLWNPRGPGATWAAG